MIKSDQQVNAIGTIENYDERESAYEYLEDR
jgi:hypothetical protein